MTSDEQKQQESLNPFQATRLRITCQYIDKVLGDIEGILNTTASKAAFPRYAVDILPVQRRTMEDYIARVRSQLVRILEGQHIAREKPSIPVSRAVHVNLGAIDIAAEELKPGHMVGYGDVPPWVATELDGIVGELTSLIHRFDRYVSEGVGEDLKARLQRLDQPGNDLELLRRVEQVIRERGLVEFRPLVAAILDRAEDRSFEIAVFGRVSSGKSSLLNAMLETAALPVGVTPITAVPTRIVYGEEPSLTVWFSEAPRKELEIARLPEYVTEQQNAGNSKHVVRLVLRLPSRRLLGGVTFVDTPGLGSLAASGASETLAYLPRCDLGVVLIDAGSTLTAEDLQTVLTLGEAAIPVHVLLSKADLLGSEDRERIARYIREHIVSECKLSLEVHPVSVRPSCRGMLDDWFEKEILSLYARSQDLRAASLRRKIGALRDSVAAALEARLRRGQQTSAKSRAQAEGAETLLRKTTGVIEEVRSACTLYVEGASETAPEAIDQASKRFLHAWSKSDYGVVVPGQLVRDSVGQFVQVQARKLQTEITALARQLGADLGRCAADLGIPDAPSEEEFASLVRGEPVFELPSFHMTISRPFVMGFLGQRAMEGSVARQISRRLPPAFYAALEAYWRLAGNWSSSVIGQLKQKFDTYAENYRAQAEQLLGGRELSGVEARGVEESLAAIKVETTSVGATAGQQRADAMDAPQEEAV
ncbi:MAG TPA: dynamin family protein [Candidatus Acidoferrum sp.]|nr:dynamin family protein [Candidatus Acidoferrum sp.]